MNNLIIRHAQLADLEDVKKLSQLIFEKEFDEFDPELNLNWTYSNYGEKYFVDRINQIEGLIFVCEIQKQIIGYSCSTFLEPLSYRISPKAVEIDSIYIIDKFRNKQIGTELINFSIGEFKNRGFGKVVIKASVKNLKAINLYNRLGFKGLNIELEQNI